MADALRISEVCRIYGMSAATVHDRRRKGKLIAWQTPGRGCNGMEWRFDKDSCEACFRPAPRSLAGLSISEAVQEINRRAAAESR